MEAGACSNCRRVPLEGRSAGVSTSRGAGVRPQSPVEDQEACRRCGGRKDGRAPWPDDRE